MEVLTPSTGDQHHHEHHVNHRHEHHDHYHEHHLHPSPGHHHPHLSMFMRLTPKCQNVKLNFAERLFRLLILTHIILPLAG